MPQYWLKPLGVTDPPHPMPNDWTVGESLDEFHLRTGPATHQKRPQMSKGDRVLFHAVTHVRLFAEGELLDYGNWYRDPVWGFRWPWVYLCRIDTWMPSIGDGVPTTEIAPKKAMGRIQRGGDFASLSPDEYKSMLDVLLSQPNVRRRERR